jgi:AcrR family transcriptional regulator
MARPRTDVAPRIVTAARARFLAEGVDGASLRAIAADAGTSIGMIYYYYPTKDDLFLAVVEEIYVAFLQDVEREVAADRPVGERLLRLYRRLGAMTDDERAVVRLVVREALTSTTRLERVIERFRRGHVPLLARLVREGQDEGVFDPALHPMLILAAMGAIGGPGQALLRLAAGRLPVARGLKQDDLPGALARVLLDGVGGAGAP